MLSTALGAGLVGVGMSLAGACPGTVMAQLGSGTSGAWIALLGGVGGVLVLAFVEGGVKKCVHPVCKVEGKGVEEVVKIPYIIAVTGSFIACTAFVVICAVVLPNSQPFTPTIVDERNILIVSAWAPWASGIAIGLLQIPTILLTQQPLGMSSGLVAILSPIATYILKPLNLISDSSEIAKWNFPSLRAFSKILNIAAVILGAFVSAVISGMVGVAPGLISGVPVEKGGPYTIGEGAGPIVQTVVGGFVMYFGARMAGGCPSGHGISGFSFLASTSVVAVPCMFAGGIATAFAVKAIAGL
ncbi:hypothetical protein HK102_013501 [Quaeritorhiza haematococci]|nr:hypothetical protein HK102_013501 [Quaeritorhiza haematococci]